MDYSPPGSSAHGNLQARILEWVAISFFGEYSQPKDQTHISCVSCIGRKIVYHQAPGGKSLYNIVIWICDWNRPGSNSSFATRYHGVLRVPCNLANRHNLLYPVEWCWHWDETQKTSMAIKKNKILQFAATWMNLEIFILSEIRQTERDKYWMRSLMCGI